MEKEKTEVWNGIMGANPKKIGKSYKQNGLYYVEGKFENDHWKGARGYKSQTVASKRLMEFLNK